MPELIAVPSVKFEILLPVTYVDPADPTETPQFVQLTEIFDYLDEMTVHYGGYTTIATFLALHKMLSIG